MTHQIGKPTALLLLLMVLLIMTGCAVNPVTGERELALVSQGQELAIGAEQYRPSQQAQGGVYTLDPALGRYVASVGQRLAKVSDRQLPYEFVVLNDATPNAWALPGGKIAVNRGLLLELNNEAELAAVLGHEIVHAAARHGANAMQRGMLLQGALLVTALSAADSDYANYIVGGAQLGAQLITTRYGRDAELEADYYGMQYMARAGYDPSAAISLQETFVRLSKDRRSSWLEGLFASHPPSQQRVDANRNTAAELGRGGERNASQYASVLEPLRARAPAYAAMEAAQKLAAAGKLESAEASIQRGISLLPTEPRLHGTQGDILLAQSRFQPAFDAFDRALQLDDGYFEYYLGRGLAGRRLGHKDQARLDLQHSMALLPTAIASNELGQIAMTEGDTAAAKRFFQTAMNAGGQLGASAATAYARLDIADNPGQYISAQPSLSQNGYLVAQLQNRSNLALRNIDVTFKVRVNGQALQRAVALPRLGASSQAQVASGWQFAATDTIEGVQVSITRATAE